MFVRCPACQTVFRVRPQQLRAHHGDVRCGRCYAQFNALDHLFEAASPAAVEAETSAPSASPTHAPAPAPTPVPAPPTSIAPPPAPLRESAEDRRIEAASPAAAATGGDGFFILEERDEPGGTQDELPLDEFTAPDVLPPHDFGGRLDFEIPDSLVARRTPGPERTQPRREPTAGGDAFPEFLDLSDLSPAPPTASPAATDRTLPTPFGPWASRREPAISYAPFAPPEPPREDVDDGLSSSTSEAAERVEHPSADASPASGTEPRDEDDESTHAAPPEGATGELEPSASELARLDATYGAPAPARRRALMGIAVGILLGALVVQSVYLFRDDITRRWPALRPAFVSACERFHCTIPLPRIAAAISIEASDLQSEPGRPGRLQLNATIRNRAAHPQAYPHLELTLTDAQDRPVVRRVLTPEEWLPPAILQPGGLELGFLPNRDIVLRLPFDAPGVTASGYRLYVFYP